MIMTKKEQFKVLETHYQGCPKYWKEQDEPISPEIIQKAVGKYSKSVTKVIQSTYVGKLDSPLRSMQ